MTPNDVISNIPPRADQVSNIWQQWKRSPKNKLYKDIIFKDYEKGLERVGRWDQS